MGATLSPLIHLIDDDAAVRDSLALLIGTVGLRVQAWADPQSFMARQRAVSARTRHPGPWKAPATGWPPWPAPGSRTA